MNRILLAAVVFLALVSPLATTGETAERTSTVGDRELVNVTVYNGSMSLVHDRRKLSLDEGVNRIAWRDVSAQMDATSALLEDLDGGAVQVLEQNLDYDLLNPSALLQKYVGRDVVVVHDPQFAGQRETRETARVLAANDGSVVLRYRDRIETEVRGHIVFPTATGTFRDQPTLVLDLASTRGGAQTVDLSYLTSGLSWRADYVGALSNDEKRMNLSGLVTLTNESGTSYDDARVQLVAGNVNVVTPTALRAATLVKSGTTNDVYSVNAQQENYFEYHLYTLGRRTTIENNQTKQVTLLSAHAVPIRKTLELRGSPSYYESADADLGDKLPVGVYISFDNRGGDLGIPLPGGVVRLYKNDSHGLSQFLGSDSIQHTPKNETIRLHLGDSFDVTAKKKQTDFRFVGNGSCATVSSYEIRLGNAKPQPQDVLVIEPIPAQWAILDENLPHVKTSSSTATWTVHVPAESHTTLTYTSRVTWCG
ncbi:MAG TPA: DUF4139 domain-containing protein [Candidatus Baltobacteraceae bacterium]|jgi:hypothetical protein|nr:DUF4139 domain-containing protein [Candidatus Baltobacteraceae bacterium]